METLIDCIERSGPPSAIMLAGRIAFIDARGVILNIRDMMPYTLDGHPSEGEALYALEVNRGWFAARGIRPGDRVLGLDKAGRGR